MATATSPRPKISATCDDGEEDVLSIALAAAAEARELTHKARVRASLEWAVEEHAGLLEKLAK